VHTTHSDLPLNPNPRSLGNELLKAVRSEHGDYVGVLDRISALPRYQASQLSDVAVQLCRVQHGRETAENVSRSHIAGARLTIQCGLAFDTHTVNRELLPALMRVPAIPSGRDTKDVWRVRLVRTLALGQLAPRIHDAEVDDVLKAVLAHSKIEGSSRSALFLPLAGFEESFRIGAFLHDSTLRTEARDLCLGGIADLLELAVEGLAESTPETFTDVLSGLLPWTQVAAVSLLTMAPSLDAESRQVASAHAERIVDAMEWLIKRPFGFPGDYFSRSERSSFESVRSLVCLAYGVLVSRSSAWRERFEELRFPEPQGLQFLGTALLGSMQRVGVEAAVEWGKDIARSQLLSAAQPNEFASQFLIEAIALSWHFGAGNEAEFERVMEFARNPSAQLLCAKAISDLDPWGEG
jgi:hypothetical protein